MIGTISDTQLNSLVSPLVEEFTPLKIILFGSQAWGNPTMDSDIDIMVIIRSSDEKPAKRAARAYRCIRGSKMPAEIIVATEEELARYASVPTSLSHKILTRGKYLYR